MLNERKNSGRGRRSSRPEADGFRSDVLAGLTLQQKRLPSKYFYDVEGAKLFTWICQLPEYYITRTEMAILRQTAAAIARLVPRHAVVVEFGSGSSRKIEILLDQLDRPAAYVPIDVSSSCLKLAAGVLGPRYPRLSINPVHADFTQLLEFKDSLPAGPRLGFFPGSTIGNFDPVEAATLLRRFASLLGPGSQLVVGVDVKKDVRRLHAAYNDAAGVTAAFNLNVLQRANRELGANFSVDHFVHRAPYNRASGRIEMHLVSQRTQMVDVGDEHFSFRRGESIHTENSYKYDIDEFIGLAEGAGFDVQKTWTDRRRSFSVHLLLCS